MVGAAGPERRDCRADDDLKEHGDGDEGIASLVTQPIGALVGDNARVDAFVSAGEERLRMGQGEGKFLAAKEASTRLGRYRRGDAKGRVESKERRHGQWV